MPTSRPFLFVLLLSCLPHIAGAQGLVTASYENPANFIAPGESLGVLIRFTNPADSGFTVHDHSGPGLRSSITPTHPSASEKSSPENCNSTFGAFDRVCIESGSFPIAPGESAVIKLFEVTALPELEVGTVIEYSGMNVSVYDEQRASQRTFPPGSIVFIVTPDGEGDPAVFEQYNIHPDVEPYTLPRLTIDYHHLTEIAAGEGFHVIAQIQNTGTSTLQSLIPRGLNLFTTATGAHADSFDIVPCPTDCILRGQLPLAPGETLSLDIGNWYYRADMLFNGEVRLNDLEISTSDSEGRSGDAVITSEGVTVNVVSANGTIPNYAYLGLSQQPLELRDLNSSGDQLIVRDYNTGYDWLKLSVSEGKTLTEIEQLYAFDGPYAGFSLATAEQVEDFIFNYLRDQGMNLLPHQIQVYSDQLNDRLKDFAAYMEAEGVRGNGFLSVSSDSDDAATSYHQRYKGIVRNSPLRDADKSNRRTLVNFETFYASNSPNSFFVSYSPKVSRTETNLSTNSTEQFAWLVRSNEPPRLIPFRSTYYVLEELSASSVQVGQDYYDIKMRFRNRLSNLVQLVSATPVSPSITSNVFDAANNRLTLPEVILPTGVRDNDTYSVEMEYIDGTDPALFWLIRSDLTK